MQREYTGSDVNMLTAASVIVENAINNKAALIAKRTTWRDPFFQNLKADLDRVITLNLGTDNLRAQRQATLDVLAVQKTALRLLGEVKVQIEEDFRQNPDQRDELLTSLGFRDHYRSASGKDQEALLNLLYQFQTNLTPTTQGQLTAAGTDPNTLISLTGLAQNLKSKNVNQEILKGTSKQATEADVQAFNAIYNRVLSVARISARFFKADPALASQFSFRKVTANLSRQPNNAVTPPPPSI